MLDSCRSSYLRFYFHNYERNDDFSHLISTLRDIRECLGTRFAKILQERGRITVVFTSEDFAIKEDHELGSSICWLIPNAQKNEMEPILVTIDPGGKTYPDNPHEGEEFGYILDGNITIVLGQRRIKAKKGESFMITPGVPHHLENKSRKQAKILWISTPPSF